MRTTFSRISASLRLARSFLSEKLSSGMGSPIDPDSVNWSTADVRSYSFIQPPGGKNPLGTVKFMFPNKHDVYMHDTIERSLFSQPNRALSHGCIRVQNPRRFAEVMLMEGNGVSQDEADAIDLLCELVRVIDRNC